MMKRKTSDEGLHLCRTDSNSYDSLRQQASERCEFCDKVSSSRLANIKHNATHIIIPLIKLSVHQCEECLFHFTSLNDLRTHATTKNHVTSQLNTQKAGYQGVLESIVKKEAVVKCLDTFKMSSLIVESPVHVTEKLKVEKELEAPIELSSDSDRSSPSLDIDDKNSLLNPDIYNHSETVESIKSRITFEDDFDDDLFEPEEILPDKYYPPKNSYIIGSINRNLTPVNGTSGSINRCLTPVNGTSCSINRSLTPVNGTSDSNGVKRKRKYRSIHYDDLVAADICDCRYCGRCFGNRLELIKHETTHMQVIRTLPVLCYVCEKYLSGNHWTLRKHLQKYHPTQERKLSIQKCTYCHLNYHNYHRHANMYHFLTCKVCNRRFDKKKYKYHDCFEPEVNETILKLCEMCLTFTKNRHNLHYEVIREHSEIGTRQQCDKCLAKYFEVKLVRRKVKARVEGDGWKRKTPMTNQDRLKKMQKRLKMANKMNNIYFVVFFTP